LYSEDVGDDSALAELAGFAMSYRDEAFDVRDAWISRDEGQDGEPVTRVLLVLSDPARDTWDVDRIRDLRLALGRKATELGLPPVTLTLVAESEAEEVLAS
jgi:hypothetical protein